MIIHNLDHLENLAASTPRGGQSIALSLNQGLLQLSLNGKELLKTTLTENPTDLNIAIDGVHWAARWQQLYQLGALHGVDNLLGSTGAGTMFWQLPGSSAIYAVASSSISVSPTA